MFSGWIKPFFDHTSVPLLYLLLSSYHELHHTKNLPSIDPFLQSIALTPRSMMCAASIVRY